MARKRSSHGRGRGKKEKKVFPQVVGRVQMTREGYAFVIVEGEEDDVFVKASKTRGALHGDTVRVSVTREKQDRQRREGEIVEIIQRSPKPFIGILHIVANQAWVLMQSRFMPYDITIPFTESDKERYRRHKVRNRSVEEQKDETGYLKPLGDDMFAIHRVFELGEDGYGKQEMKVRSGMKVAAVVDDWPRHEMSPRGHIIDVLGEPGENDTEMHAILAEYALPYRFESEVANAADRIPEEITAEDLKGRRDFRNVLTFTIDPKDAKDFDDALSIRPIKPGLWEVGVHIADVTHYVKEGSSIDKEAEKRATSVYLVDRTIPMLPERLCNMLCSLRPNEEKLAYSAIFEMNDKAEVKNSRIVKTVIKSDRRFTYEEAQAVIETGEGEYKEEILQLNKLAQILRANRLAHGAIDFDRVEVRFEIDEKGKPLSVYFKESKEANKLIEEFMLLANRTVAEFIGKVPKNKKAKVFPYRIHDLPDPDKLENLNWFVNRFGYKIRTSGTKAEVSKSINKLLASIKEKKEQNLIEMVSLKAMQKAKYSTHNIGHYGLAFDYYTHFTSPIRRFPDMMVHRLLSRYLAGGRTAQEAKYEDLCDHSSNMEQIAANAERASIKYKQVEFMGERMGQEFDGTISGVTEWGLYVEINENKCEGMIPMRELDDDYYDFDEKSYCLTGRRYHKKFSLGDPIRIKVVRANLERKQLDFALI